MDILGYIGYAVLIFMAVTFTVGVRVKLGAGVNTIFIALFFLTSAIYVGVSGINKLHSWWIVPSGFALGMFISILSVRIPALCYLIKPISSVFAIIVRIGIPDSKIKVAQEADSKATIKHFFTDGQNNHSN